MSHSVQSILNMCGPFSAASRPAIDYSLLSLVARYWRPVARFSRRAGKKYDSTDLQSAAVETCGSNCRTFIMRHWLAGCEVCLAHCIKTIKKILLPNHPFHFFVTSTLPASDLGAVWHDKTASARARADTACHHAHCCVL